MKAKADWKRLKTRDNEKKLAKISKEYRGLKKKTMKSARRNYHTRLKTMKYNNPTEYWREVKDKVDNDCPISLEDLFNHFQTLNEVEDDDHNNDHDTQIDIEYDTDFLNAPITKDELVKASNKLKNNKATGVDNVRNEYIKHSITCLADAYCKLFNKVVDTGSFQMKWVLA